METICLIVSKHQRTFCHDPPRSCECYKSFTASFSILPSASVMNKESSYNRESSVLSTHPWLPPWPLAGLLGAAQPPSPASSSRYFLPIFIKLKCSKVLNISVGKSNRIKFWERIKYLTCVCKLKYWPWVQVFDEKTRGLQEEIVNNIFRISSLSSHQSWLIPPSITICPGLKADY